MSDSLTIRYTKDYPQNPTEKAGFNPNHTVSGYVVEAKAGEFQTLSASVARDRVAAGFAELVS